MNAGFPIPLRLNPLQITMVGQYQPMHYITFKFDEITFDEFALKYNLLVWNWNIDLELCEYTEMCF